MSSQSPDNIFDLEQHFLPAWAKQSPQENRFADYEGEPDRRRGRPRDRRDRPGRPPQRRDRPAGRGPGDRQSGRRNDPRGRDDRRRDDRRREGRQPRPARPAPIPLPEINVALVPDDKGVDSLAKQIKMTGRAYPLFDIAHMILAKPERHSVTFSVQKTPEGKVQQPLYLCALDESLWLTREAAMEHLLDRHFTTFYQPERTEIEPPKGTYTFVAQCGMSGVILGPPNHHDYQNRLRKLHAEQFSRMPFETFKARVKIVRDEAVVKKWIEEQSYTTKYVCLNMPEPLTLNTREEVAQHFRETHLNNLVQEVETHRMSGVDSRSIRELGLRRLARQVWEDQRRFPLQIATVLSQQFAARGLQFFKVKKTVTHVSVARPRYLDLEVTPVSETVRQIVNFINAHPKCSHKEVLDTLAPMPEADETAEPPPERTTLIADLHWLVHEGHVIEFANGIMEMAKKPLPKPPKPAPAPTPSATGPTTSQSETSSAPELTPANKPATAPAPAATAVPAESAATAAAVSPTLQQESVTPAATPSTSTDTAEAATDTPSTPAPETLDSTPPAPASGENTEAPPEPTSPEATAKPSPDPTPPVGPAGTDSTQAPAATGAESDSAAEKAIPPATETPATKPEAAERSEPTSTAESAESEKPKPTSDESPQ